jgi:ribosome-associated protein
LSEPRDPNRPDPPAAPGEAPSADAGAAVPEHLPELQWIVDALDDKRAKDVVVMDLAPLTVSVDCFVIASGESQPQIEALEDAVRETMKEHGRLPRGVETPSSRWVLLDYGGVVVHIMSPEARAFYDIEGLWADAEELPIEPS